MKNLFISTFLFLATIVSSFANTSDLELPTEENSAKLVKMVNNASPDDWKNFKNAALLTINWQGDLEVAKEWIDTALSIDENGLTLEVLGDYYVSKGDEVKARDTYFKALENGFASLDQKDINRLQRKILVYARR
ncbi:hypothetical protein EI427_15265 [Flammeovirga pectinis]|uniref:Tetratricopeptide repeat protein n=1 Tax=Flammeovirga pectinis TaxID=2494373 RepID=A0A3Q9FRG5_9BACT|nr:hypothetical protein [Flammeovirga pectinis]AZQ63531.1 hypothetical protein EI427_15265 [Flammeovirga pectinis]